jgi:hypothetical protein
MHRLLTFLFLLITCVAFAQDTAFLKVHFLYGSRPLKKYKDIEPAWFGGILGGHVGIEGDNLQIVNFVPAGSFHFYDKKNNRHSRFTIHSPDQFYAIFGSHPDSVKKAIVKIPVTARQKQQFDSITAAYLKETPYDYALLGMRCGAAAYDILAQVNILPDYTYKQTYKRIFYPRKLRKRLFEKASENNWTVLRAHGTQRRKWERD